MQKHEEQRPGHDVTKVEAREVGHPDHAGFAFEDRLSHRADVVVASAVEQAIEMQVLVLQGVGQLVHQKHFVGVVDTGEGAEDVELDLRPPRVVVHEDHRALFAVAADAVVVVDAARKVADEAPVRRRRVARGWQNSQLVKEAITPLQRGLCRVVVAVEPGRERRRRQHLKRDRADKRQAAPLLGARARAVDHGVVDDDNAAVVYGEDAVGDAAADAGRKQDESRGRASRRRHVTVPGQAAGRWRSCA